MENLATRELISSFVAKTREQYGTYDFATGYLMSMLTRIAEQHPKIAKEIRVQLTHALAKK